LEHGSILNGNIRPRRVSSQWQSTRSPLKDENLVSDELAEALVQLYKSCKYARRVDEFDLPEETVFGYVRATNEAIQALKKA